MDSSTVSKDVDQYVQEEVYEKVPHMAIRLMYLRVRNCSAVLSSSHENFFQPFFLIIFCTCLSVLHLHCIYVSTGSVKAYLLLSLPCFSHQSNYNFVQMLHDTILHTSITFPLALSFLVMLVQEIFQFSPSPNALFCLQFPLYAFCKLLPELFG